MNNNNNETDQQKKWPKINVWKKRNLLLGMMMIPINTDNRIGCKKKPTTMFKYKQTMNERTNEGQWQFGNERNV